MTADNYAELVARLRSVVNHKSLDWIKKASSIIPEAADAISDLRAELDHFKRSGIIEVAVRNASVSEYMDHWEGRTERAEAERDQLRAEVEAYKAENVRLMDEHAVELARVRGGRNEAH